MRRVARGPRVFPTTDEFRVVCRSIRANPLEQDRDAIAVVISQISISHLDRVTDRRRPFLGPSPVVLPLVASP
jgi:hypothetical protein